MLRVIVEFFKTLMGLRGKTADTITGFFFMGSGASWISEGRTELLLPEDGWTITPKVDRNGEVVSFRIENPKQKEFWSLDFAAPKGTRMGVGQFDGATRYPFQRQTDPGLDFSGCHRGNNRLTGQFKVLEVTIRHDKVISFAADFSQYDETSVERWSTGSLRFNSNKMYTSPADTLFA